MSSIQLRAINVNLLVALDALLKTSSVTEAARRSGVTPSAMSHTLRQLRELFEDPLLVRTQHGLRLTPRAEALAPALSRALGELERALVQDATFDPSKAERRFVVAAPDFIGTELLTHVARHCAEHCPGLDLDLLPSNRRAEAWRLESGEVDAVVGAILDDMARVELQPLYRERFVLIARRGHPELARTGPSPAAIAALPHVLIGINDRYVHGDSWVDQQLAERGLARRVVLRQRYFVSVVRTVAETELVSIVPNTLARWAARTAEVEVHEVPFALPTYEEHLAWSAVNTHDPAHRWLRERLVEAARALVARTPAREAPRAWEGPVPAVQLD